MTTIFLTHTPDMLANYYGNRALTALREHQDGSNGNGSTNGHH